MAKIDALQAILDEQIDAAGGDSWAMMAAGEIQAVIDAYKESDHTCQPLHCVNLLGIELSDGVGDVLADLTAAAWNR
jgi:hypothetical protein